MLRVKNPQDLAAGLFLIVIGAAALWFSRDLTMGTIERMGPRYFPFVVSCGLAGIGLILALRSLVVDGEKLQPWSLKINIVILGSIALFAALIERLGLAMASAAMILVCSFVARDYRWRESLLFALGMVVFVVLLFSVALGLSIRIWPW